MPAGIEYQLHHLCIYEKQPRDAMWAWLRWYHGIPAFYWTGMDGFHHTDEGHVDYTFLACGGAFQLQLESPPFQFEYERNWFDAHDSAINHICWIVPDAKATIEPLEGAGCEVAMPYEEFEGVYNGFVAIDPEGRWIEIMSYVNGFKTPDVEFYPWGPEAPDARGRPTVSGTSMPWSTGTSRLSGSASWSTAARTTPASSTSSTRPMRIASA